MGGWREEGGKERGSVCGFSADYTDRKKKISHYYDKKSKPKPFKWQCAPEDGRTSWVSAKAQKNRMRGRDGAKYSPQ